ncbi:spermidine/putrescine ABC transporter ATP-binding protein [Candidatus Poribacteria bacterium]|nr:MAG: spermidine/putrescine ABC transporter ATP-binding protein [Candidatus Poribacteria bacterium]
MAVAVELTHVTKAFGTTLAVNDVSLKIEKGEFFFLLGPSGCGKSTFLRIVAGFYKPDTGELRFDDTVMNNVPPHQRNTGMVFQNYALWPHMSVAENIEYGLTLRKLEKEERQEKIDRALEMVQMEGYHDRAVNTLSGGQQQRIALARALVIEPSVLLLDEPISNLDAALRQQMRDEIKQIHDRTNITMFYVTHDQVDALSMADRMAIMQDGVIIQVGTPREIYQFPRNAFVASFVGETNFISGKVQSVSNGTATIETPVGVLHSETIYHELTQGIPVQCSIRPEALVIDGVQNGNSPADNTIDAKVTVVNYLGRVEEYQLVAADIPLKAVHYNPGTEAKRPGDTIQLAISAEAVIPLPE